jgi:hypothetical protein
MSTHTNIDRLVLSADLAQASVTGYCPQAALLRRLGVRSGAAFRA